MQLRGRSQSAPGTCSRPTRPKGARDISIPAPPTEPHGQHRDPEEAGDLNAAPEEVAPSLSPTEDMIYSRNLITLRKSPNGPALDGSDEIPPAVPPKSPRTAGRATPVLREQHHLNTAAHVAMQNTVDPELNAQDRQQSGWWTTQKCGNGSRLQRSVSATSGRNLPSSGGTTSRGDIALDRLRELDSPKHDSPIELEAIPAGRSSPFTGHQIPPETSIIDRGRPTKRIIGVIKRSPSKAIRSESSPEWKSITNLPAGICVADAAYRLSKPQMRDLRDEAIKQAERFEILPAKDFAALSEVSLHQILVVDNVTESQ